MDTGLRTSTNAGLGGGLAVIIMWLAGFFAPALMATAPVGVEGGLAVIIMWLVARLSKTVSNPGTL